MKTIDLSDNELEMLIDSVEYYALDVDAEWIMPYQLLIDMNIAYMGMAFEESPIYEELLQDAIDAIDEMAFYANNHQKLRENFYQNWATSGSQSEAIKRAELSDSLIELSHSIGSLKAGIVRKKAASIESPCRANCWSF